MAGVTGLEPAASGVTGRRSNQLSYTPKPSTTSRRGAHHVRHTVSRCQANTRLFPGLPDSPSARGAEPDHEREPPAGWEAERRHLTPAVEKPRQTSMEMSAKVDRTETQLARAGRAGREDG